MFETAVKHNIKDILFLGDLFQDREDIQIISYHLTYEVLSHYLNKYDINLYMLIGNHDMWFNNKTDISSIIPLGSLKNIRIIKEPETINISGFNFDFLPYTLNPLIGLGRLAKSDSNVLCGHLSLDGAQLNTFYHTHADISVEHEGDMVKVDADKFGKYKKVFLGHYHGEQRVKNVEYIGSPLQLNFAEAFQQKHIIIFDSDTFEQEYIINDFSPKHLIIKEKDISKYDLNNTFLKLEPSDINTTNLSDLKSKLSEQYNILTFDFSAPKYEEDEIIIEKVENIQNILVKDREILIEEYVKATGTTLPYDELITIGKKIIQKSQVN